MEADQPLEQRGLNTSPGPLPLRHRTRPLPRAYAWTEAGIGRGWIGLGRVPARPPCEFGEAMRLFWEFMYFRSRWITSYKRELSRLVDEERYADAYMLALIYDTQRHSRADEDRATRTTACTDTHDRPRQPSDDDEAITRLQRLRDQASARRDEWRHGLEDQPDHSG